MGGDLLVSVVQVGGAGEGLGGGDLLASVVQVGGAGKETYWPLWCRWEDLCGVGGRGWEEETSGLCSAGGRTSVVQVGGAGGTVARPKRSQVYSMY